MAAKKRIAGVSSGQTYAAAAHRILQSGFKEVRHWLALAAERRCDDSGENVHHLRTSARRTCAAVCAFTDLIGAARTGELRDTLRAIRKAADQARNVDVTAERFLSGPHAPGDTLRAKLAERLKRLRDDAQKPIVAVQTALAAGAFDARIKAILHDLRDRRSKLAKRSFGKQARAILKPVAQRFFEAACVDANDDEQLHRFRIQAKKLRYTMEIVAVAFPPAFGGKLCRQFRECQDVLGNIRDHVIAEGFLRGWLKAGCDAEERAYLEGMFRAETKAHADARKIFETIWTQKTIDKLKAKFEALK